MDILNAVIVVYVFRKKGYVAEHQVFVLIFSGLRNLQWKIYFIIYEVAKVPILQGNLEHLKKRWALSAASDWTRKRLQISGVVFFFVN